MLYFFNFHGDEERGAAEELEAGLLWLLTG
jgi:hypothetical protein